MLTGTKTSAEARAEWTTAYINNLPDSAFGLIEEGGSKDSNGRTTPRALRHFPHHNADGAVDLPHLRNALARVPQSSLSQALKDRALRHLRSHAASMGVGAAAGAEGDSAPPPAAWRSAGGADGLLGVECRAFGAAGLELRVSPRGGADLPTITGYAAVFDTPAFIGGPAGAFTEVVKPGAFRRSIRTNDVRALFNHDENLVMGRLDSGTLRLEEDTHGLHMEIDPPNTSLGRDVVEMVKRGDVSGASFGFTVPKGGDRWTEGVGAEPARRELLEVRLFDVSPVTFPAYAETEVSSRALAWARRALAGETLSPPELRTIQRLLPAWVRQAEAEAAQAPDGARTSVQGPSEPGAPFDHRRHTESLEAELRGGKKD